MPQTVTEGPPDFTDASLVPDIAGLHCPGDVTQWMLPQRCSVDTCSAAFNACIVDAHGGIDVECQCFHTFVSCLNYSACGSDVITNAQAKCVSMGCPATACSV
jgi:hypothetical protein